MDGVGDEEMCDVDVAQGIDDPAISAGSVNCWKSRKKVRSGCARSEM